MLMRAQPDAGFTLIELLIGIGIVGILLMLAAPAFSVYIQNSRIRNVADGIMNGVQLARTEAVRLNRPVEFAFTGGGNWSVNQVNPLQEIQSRDGNEGMINTVIDSGTSNRITFTPLGAPLATNPLDGSNPMTRIDITASTTVAGTRPLRVLISPAGNVRMCDPSTNLPTGDPQRCTQ
jgi:type IV fimbrial biogenesis protein FimT